jgi:adenylyltransferase/sulfurtransferase
MFSESELRRYSRQITLPAIGLDGQQRLARASAAVVGVGGLGTPAAIYLVAAGVRRVGLIDPDIVDPSNLHRQPMYGTSDIGAIKVERACTRLRDLNPHVEVRAHPVALTSANALDLLGRYDVVVDGTDSFATRYLVNDACVLLGRPNVYASVLKFEGQLSVFAVGDGPCYRCLFPEPPPPGTVPNCEQAGVLGVLPGLMGTLQAAEALKFLLGTGELTVGRLLLVDALHMRFRSIDVRRDPQCPACGTREITSLGDYEAFCGLGGSITEASAVREIEPSQLQAWRAEGVRYELIDVREPWEAAIASIDGSRLVPLATFANRVEVERSSTPVVLYCHHGSRSLAAARLLVQAGRQQVYNLVGGIDRYSREADPSVPRY